MACTRRTFLKEAALLSCASLAGDAFAGESGLAPRPNIVLILADDMGFSDLGCYGSEIATPNLDRLAARGVRFTSFYNTARCCPTRASLLTGLYPHQAGVGHMMQDRKLPGYRGDLNDRCVTIAEVLSGAGYRTYMAGKWHVTRYLGYWSGDKKLASSHNWPLQRGFDRFYGTVHGAGSYYDPISLTWDNTPIEPEYEPYYYTDAISEHAARFIEEHRTRKERAPFFCYVAYTAPHWPMQAPEEEIARYRGRYDEGWDKLRAERYARQRALGVIDPKWRLSPRDPRVPPWEKAKHKRWYREVMAVYAGMIDRMDQGIGKIVAALERTGALENTLLFFLSDNGACAEGGTAFDKEGRTGGLSCMIKKTRDGRPVHFGHYDTYMPGPPDTFQEYGRPWANASNTPFRYYKHYTYEGGISTPLIVHWPARVRKGGGFCRDPGHVVDLMATCVDAAGAEYPARFRGRKIFPLEGRSLLPAIDGRRLGERLLFWEHEGNRAVRRGRWKITARGAKGPWELYDLEADRTETRDLAEKDPGRVKALAAAWKAWAERAEALPWPWK